MMNKFSLPSQTFKAIKKGGNRPLFYNYPLKVYCSTVPLMVRRTVLDSPP